MVDHVLIPVADVDESARRFCERYGLQGIAGGEHPNAGTANFIVPLGQQYLELIGIVNHERAAVSRLGGRISAAVRAASPILGWALRTANLDALRSKLLKASWQLPPIAKGSRRRPDGRLLRWRTQDIAVGPEVSAFPFVIEWQLPMDLHPGLSEPWFHARQPSLRQVVVGTRDVGVTESRLRTLLGNSDLYAVRESDRDAVERVVIHAEGGDVVIE